ncbi:uncharacterized protein LOC119435183 [Dermacentor silvarum]|uniref:uncharacterized protein LOC119435183 n=1 Tax=Dermacentor silvarum TaxID=543639 RepID=UPI00189B36AE|nr:uncharacterized protein LOC119435183 [Dermacentor silvarum]
MSEPPDRQKVIENYLQGLHHHEDGYSHGYLKSDDELKLFERSLAAVNERYAVRTSRDLNKPSKSNVVFSMIHSGCRISLDNVPFRVVKETVKVCIFGMEYYKKTPEKKKDHIYYMGSSTTDWLKEVYEKKQMNRQGTKKKGCAATMNLKWIELYPEFQVDLPQPCGQTKEGRLKADKAKQLQEALDAEQQTVAKETRVYIRIADCGSHRNHGFDMPAYLHNRPHGFVDHMLRRLVNAEEYTHTDMRELPIKGMFSVHSERNDDDVHTVDFTKPSCTCPDFRKHKYPCKHFCVVFKYSDRWGFSSLPQSYLNRPQIALGSCLESETGSEIPLVNEPSPSEVSSQALGTAVSEPDIPFVNEPSFVKCLYSCGCYGS